MQRLISGATFEHSLRILVKKIRTLAEFRTFVISFGFSVLLRKNEDQNLSENTSIFMQKIWIFPRYPVVAALFLVEKFPAVLNTRSGGSKQLQFASSFVVFRSLDKSIKKLHNTQVTKDKIIAVAFESFSANEYSKFGCTNTCYGLICQF